MRNMTEAHLRTKQAVRLAGLAAKTLDLLQEVQEQRGYISSAYDPSLNEVESALVLAHDELTGCCRNSVTANRED